MKKSDTATYSVIIFAVCLIALIFCLMADEQLIGRLANSYDMTEKSLVNIINVITILSIIGLIISALIYNSASEKPTMKYTCPSCKKPVTYKQNICGNCGKVLGWKGL